MRVGWWLFATSWLFACIKYYYTAVYIGTSEFNASVMNFMNEFAHASSETILYLPSSIYGHALGFGKVKIASEREREREKHTHYASAVLIASRRRSLLRYIMMAIDLRFLRHCFAVPARKCALYMHCFGLDVNKLLSTRSVYLHKMSCDGASDLPVIIQRDQTAQFISYFLNFINYHCMLTFFFFFFKSILPT